MSQLRGKTPNVIYDPFKLGSSYTELDIYSNKNYIIMWVPKRELRVVTGAFIRGHFDKCKVLSNPNESKRLLDSSMRTYMQDYINYYDKIY